jgi:C-terminal processing protease CtpA/Prc
VKVSAQPNVYSSERVSTARAPKGAEVTQAVDATSWRGKRVTLRGMIRGEAPGEGPAVVRLKIYDQAGPRPLAELKPGVAANVWQPFEIAGDVPVDAEELEVDLGLTAGGRVGWDDLALQGPGAASTPLGNADFEIAAYDGSAAGWELARDARQAGYRAQLSTDHPQRGKESLLLSWSTPDPSAFPHPGEPLVADLGGGVSALVPLALYKDGQGTLPHLAATAVAGPDPGKPDAARPSGSDRATRLADVVLAWNVFQHFYPYFDVVQADWPGELRRALSAAATDGDERAFLVTLRRLVAALHDGHGSVFASFEGAQARLPLLWDWVEGQLVITRVAATGAGDLRPGDVVVALNGRPALEALAAIEEQVSGATPQWRRWAALNQLALSDPKSEVRIEARHPDGTAVAASLTASVVAYDRESLQETRPETIAEPRPGILYVNLDQVTEDEFKAAIDRLAAARGIVFDLRGYPSRISPIVLNHLIDHPFSSARWNVPVVTRPDRQGWEWTTSSWFEQPVAPRFLGKIAFVTDGRAISYAESYMGIVEAYHLGEIVGSPTAGTNGNVNPFTLPGGYRLTWTGMKVTKHDGSQHHGVGIQPTVPVSRTIQGVWRRGGTSCWRRRSRWSIARAFDGIDARLEREGK